MYIILFICSPIKNKFIKTITIPKIYRTYIVFIPYDKDLPKKFREDFLNVKKNHPEKIAKKVFFWYYVMLII